MRRVFLVAAILTAASVVGCGASLKAKLTLRAEQELELALQQPPAVVCMED